MSGVDTGSSSHVPIKIEEEEAAQEEQVNEQARKRVRSEMEELQQGVSKNAESPSPRNLHPSWVSPSTQPNRMTRIDNVAPQGQAEAGAQSRMLAPGARNFGQHLRRDDAVRPMPVPWLKLVLEKPGMEHLRVHPGCEKIVGDAADQTSNFLKAHLATVELCRDHPGVAGPLSSSLYSVARAKEAAAARFDEQQVQLSSIRAFVHDMRVLDRSGYVHAWYMSILACLVERFQYRPDSKPTDSKKGVLWEGRESSSRSIARSRFSDSFPL